MGTHLQAIAYALIIIGQLIVFFKYVIGGLRTWRKNNHARNEFVLEMKMNHLPHIFETLKAVCFYLKIPYEEPSGYNSSSYARADREDQSDK